MANDNKLLGSFDLVGIPPAPKGVPQIEVTFDIDANGIVQVSARDKSTGKEQQIRIQTSGGLSEEEIQKMVRDAEEHADEDKRRKDFIEVKNEADSQIYNTEKSLKEFGDKLSDSDKETLKTEIENLRKFVASTQDPEQIRTATSAFQTKTFQIFGTLHKSGEQPSAGSSEEPSKEDVEEAETTRNP